MKIALLSLLISLAGFAEFQDWESADGRVAQLDLVKVDQSEEDSLIGSFKTKSGKSVKLPMEKLSTSSQERLQAVFDAQNTAAESSAQSEPSVFFEHFDGNLLTLKGRSLKKLTTFEEPQKYYLFYYTASWCGPCQKFTPELVKFYDRQKRKHGDSFEVIVVTSDRSEEDMETYAKSKDMTFPHLALRDVKDFKEEFDHPGSGIPNIVMTDLQGEILKTSYEDGRYVGLGSVLDFLEKELR